MEVTPAGGNIQIQKEHSSTSQSSEMEVSKDIGNTKILQKGQSFSSDERSMMVEESTTQSQSLEATKTVSVSSSVQSSKKVMSSTVTSSSSFEMSEGNGSSISSFMAQDIPNNFESLQLTSNLINLDPGPIKLESAATKLSSDLPSFNIEQRSNKNIAQESFKSMSMEQESLNTINMEQNSFRSMEQESYKDKNGLHKYSPEIEEGKIKNTLKEIITEIDAYAEKDDVLRESSKIEEMEVINDGVTETKICDFQKMETVESNGKPDIRCHQDMLVARLPSCLHTSKGERPLSLPTDTLMQLVNKQVAEEMNQSFHSEEVYGASLNKVRRE